MIDFKGSQFQKEIILWGCDSVFHFLPSTGRNDAGTRGVVNHSTLNR